MQIILVLEQIVQVGIAHKFSFTIIVMLRKKDVVFKQCGFS